MSWAGTPAAPPEGYELATLRAGDTLADLEAEEAARRGLKSKADVDRVCLEITAANGLDGHKAKSCAWARDVASWVLGTGGERAPVVATQRNACEPGKGFPMFVAGQRIFLPAGLRPRAADQPLAETPAPTRAKPLRLLFGLGLAALVGRKIFSRGRA